MSDLNHFTQIPRLLVVDDDAGQRRLLAPYLSQQGFDVITASDAFEALEILGRETVGLVISDMRMPGMTGLEMLHKIRLNQPTLPVLLVTAFPDIRDAVSAMRDGAVSYLEKPIDLDELLDQVRGALGLDLKTPESPDAEAVDLPPDLVAQSPQMRRIIRDVAIVGPTDSRLLVTGESGVGKEVIADLVHRLSPRGSGPFVKVNCAAIAETLLESEMFGHEKGAFTGALNQHIGCFEQANGGTILLDEIGEMPLSLQAKLLRVTENGSFRRVGGSQDRQSDARILATTNRNLQDEVREGRFREDLFFRLNVFEICVPPLRERREDIMPLANLFASRTSKGRPRFSPPTVACLEVYAWPGNVRELRNAMERAVMMSRGEMILPEHLPDRVQAATRVSPSAGPGATDSATGRIEEVERSVILQSLRNNQYNRSETARVLGISRRALLYKLQRYREQGYAIDPHDE